MTDKEKIRKEVERLQKELIKNDEKGFGSDIDNACILELQNVLTYIDSLQEEKECDDLEQELIKWHENHFKKKDTFTKMSGFYLTRQSQLDLAKHFAEWQKQQILGDDSKQYHRLRHETLKRLYENEAKLELMLNNALEGYIEGFKHSGGHDYLKLKVPMLSKPDDCKDGDKIKLIVIKEEMKKL